MNFTEFPKELNTLIQSFAFGECNKCYKYYHFTELTNKCIIFEYRNVFQDEYWMKDDDEICEYNLICKNCIHMHDGKIIVNLRDNTYCWIKDYSGN